MRGERPRMGKPDRQAPQIGRLVGRLLDPGDKLLHRKPGTQRGRLAHQFTPKNRVPLLYGCCETGISGVVAELVPLGLGQDAKECRVAVCHPVTECKAADENGDAAKNAVEEIEGAHGTYADEVKQRALDAQIRERLMQALEDSICANCLLLLFRHRPLELRREMSTPISTEWSAFRRPTARSKRSL